MNLPVKQLFRFRLRTKITFLVLLIVLLIMGTVSIYNMRFDFLSRQEKLEDRMQQITKAIVQVSSSLETRSDWFVFQDYIDNFHKALDNIVYIALYDENGTMQAYVLNEDLVNIPPDVTVTDSVLKDAVVRLESGSIEPAMQFFILYPVFSISLNELGNVTEDIRFGRDVIGQVRMGYSKMELNDELIGNRNRNVNMLIVFVLIGLLASLLLSHRLTKPLTRLSAAMETVPHGKMDTIAEMHSSDEIGSLAKSFNYMVNELRENDFFNQFERDLGKAFTLDKIFVTLLGRLESLYGINKGALFIKQKQSSEYVEVYQHKFAINFPADFHVSVEKSLENHLRRDEICFSLDGLKIISDEIPSLRPALSVAREYQIHWTVFLHRQNACLGVMYFGSDTGDFTVDIEEKKYIVNLVRHAMLPIEVALLHADLTEKERLKKELEIARTVQSNLLPQRMPELQGYDVFGICIPAREVGGDYFDYVQIDKNRLGVVIADVAGKSTSAAFYMAEIKGMIVSLSALYNSPRELLKVLNYLLFINVDRKVFVSMIYGVLNTKSDEFVFARAGHNPLLVKHASENDMEYQTANGLALGLDRGKIFDAVITEKKVKLRKGDVLLLYTDGVVESRNSNYVEFGEERLQNIILRQEDITSETGCLQILNEIRAYSTGTEQFDDVTMVMIRRGG